MAPSHMIQLHASGRVLRLCRAPSFLLRAPLLRRISVNARGGDKAHFGHVRGSALHRLVAGVLEAARGPLFSAFLAEDRPAHLAARLAVLGCRPAIAASALHPLYCCSRAVDRIDRLWGLDLKSIRYAAGGKEVPVELLVARRASSTSREFGKS